MSLFSFGFIIFLIITVFLYYTLFRSRQRILLILASIVFYCLEDGYRGVIFVVITTVSSYAVGLIMEKTENGRRKAVMICSLVLNFGILAVLKYGSFFLDNVNMILSRFGIPGMEDHAFFILPLGISFYTFQATGYIIDVYRKKHGAEHDFLDFVLFVSYFPQMIQGPISTYGALAPELSKKHTWDSMNFREGALRILWGFFKKLILADRAAVIVNEVFQNYEVNDYRGFIILAAGLLYAVQLYADFSGGMDMVYGVSLILGVNLTENFRQPYFSKTVTEFWQRWHITLGAWMEQYVFYPLCLSEMAGVIQRKTRKRFGAYYGKFIVPSIASFITFVIVGIWHGAEWEYVAYGIYMAFLVSSNKLLARFYGNLRGVFRIDPETAGWKVFQIVRTNILVMIGRFFSRGSSVHDALAMIRAMFSSFNPQVFFNGTFESFGIDSKDIKVMMLSTAVLFLVDLANEKGVILRKKIAGKPLPFRWVVFYLGIASVLIFGLYGPGYDASSFIYQHF